MTGFEAWPAKWKGFTLDGKAPANANGPAAAAYDISLHSARSATPSIDAYGRYRVALPADAGSSSQQHNHVFQRNESDLAFLKRLAGRNGFFSSPASPAVRHFYDALIVESTLPAMDASASSSRGFHNALISEVKWPGLDASHFQPRAFDVEIEAKNAPASGPVLRHELTHTIQQQGGVRPGDSADDRSSTWVRVGQLPLPGSMVLPSQKTIIGGFKSLSGMDSETAGVIQTPSGIRLEMEDSQHGGGYPALPHLTRDAEKGNAPQPEPFRTIDGIRVPEPVRPEAASNDSRQFNLLSNVMKTKTDSARNTAGFPSPAGPVPIPFPNFESANRPSTDGDPDRPFVVGRLYNGQSPFQQLQGSFGRDSSPTNESNE